MAKSVATIEEYFETLKRSSLPTVVTEGRDDYVFFRRIENNLSGLGISLLPVGGKSTVLELFSRRKHLGRNNVAFLVDLDSWIFFGTPAEYLHRKMIMTEGYSIENDLYRDGHLESLLSDQEKEVFDRELHSIIEWIYFCIDIQRNGISPVVSTHPNALLDSTGCLCPIAMEKLGFTGPAEPLFSNIFLEYARLLRGKTLLQLLVRQLNKHDREIKHGRKQLIEYAASRQGRYYSRICEQLRGFFQPEAVL